MIDLFLITNKIQANDLQFVKSTDLAEWWNINN
jgi:hypothetical protein